MGYTEFKNGQAPYLSESTLMEMQKGLMKLVFPIGATYITQDETNPSNILKFGTWERLKGKVCVGLDEDTDEFNQTGKEGGETKHTITTQEMPKHNHTANGKRSAIAEYAYKTEGDGFSVVSSQTSGSARYNISVMDLTGNNQPHNNLQPYKVVGYMWIRTT